MTLFDAILWPEVFSTVFYTLLGLVLLWGAWKVLEFLTPFSIVKEIEEDQNTALAILISAVFISAAIIIAAVILS